MTTHFKLLINILDICHIILVKMCRYYLTIGQHLAVVEVVVSKSKCCAQEIYLAHNPLTFPHCFLWGSLFIFAGPFDVTLWQ